MEIEEYIYEGVVQPYYKKPTREYSNNAGYRRGRVILTCCCQAV